MTEDQKQIEADTRLREAERLEKEAEKQSQLLDRLASEIRRGGLRRIDD